MSKPLARLLARREADVLRAVLDYLRLTPGLRWRQNVTTVRLPGKDGVLRPYHFGVKGLPDILGSVTLRCAPCAACGRTGKLALALAVECKGDEGRLRGEQEAMLAVMREEGWLVVVARSVEDVRSAIEARLGGV